MKLEVIQHWFERSRPGAGNTYLVSGTRVIIQREGARDGNAWSVLIAEGSGPLLKAKRNRIARRTSFGEAKRHAEVYVSLEEGTVNNAGFHAG